MSWDDASYSGFKLNCHKKKRKVLSLIELYDKDSVNTVQDKEIYKDKLNEISSAAFEAIEYINDLIAQLEVVNEERKIAELLTIKKAVTDAVKKNEKEVKQAMQEILDASVSPQGADQNTLTLETVREMITGMNVASTAAADLAPPPSASPDLIPKLRLRHGHLTEDLASFKESINGIKLATELTDSEVMYYMREFKTWKKQMSDIVSLHRKLQEDTLGKAELNDMMETLNNEVVVVKTLLENKIAVISHIDSTKGLNSLCENKNRSSIVFPEPFKGNFGDNVYKFKEEIVAAIRDSQVKKSDEVKTLLKYLKGEAKLRVGEHQPSLDAALDVLIEFYGNPSMIWLKCRQDFENSFSGDIAKHWGELGSSKRVDAIARVMEFIRQAKQYATEYPELNNEIISSHTVNLLTKSMPVDYLEMVYLAIEDASATPLSKIEKMEEILGKLKTCGILAVNQLVSKDITAAKTTTTSQKSVATRNPLSMMSGPTICSVDVKHNCHKNNNCEPSWGLLGCVELYKLKTVEQRTAYCRESGCCYICGGDMSGYQNGEDRHRFCDYNNPVDRFLVKCTVLRSTSNSGKKNFCFYGAALCPHHQSRPNTNSKLIDWLKKKRIKHELFTIKQPSLVSKSKNKCKDHQDMLTDPEVTELIKNEMSRSEFENGEVAEIPPGENMFTFLMLQGKPGTEPMQVFCDSGANLWFGVESVTKKLVCVRTYKGELPINIAGGKVIHATGEWGAALPMSDGTYQAVRGLTMRSVVGQMPRFNLERTLNEVKHTYKHNTVLQSLKIPEVLGGDIDMILGSKFLKIYPEPIQTTPSGLTVSMSKLRAPGGKCAVISGPVKFINQIFESKFAKDCVRSMKAMLLHLSEYKPMLEHFPKPASLSKLADDDIPGIEDLHISNHKTDQSLKSSSGDCKNESLKNIPQCNVTAQSELQKFMELQEAGLKSDFRCRQCRGCTECKRGAGQEKLSLRQEAEQELVKESVTIDASKGCAVAKLPFTLPPETYLKNNRNIALKMLDRLLYKYCRDLEQRKTIQLAWNKLIDKEHLVFVKDLSPIHQKLLENAPVSYYIPWNLQFKESISTPIRPVFNASSNTSSGLSLNDVLAKGVPDLVKLLSVMLDWQMGLSGVCGDISQFYPTIKLVPEHWCFQRILLRQDLDPEGNLLEAVLVKLAFGVQSVSSQSEETVKKVARSIWLQNPDVASFLIRQRYVDDLAKSCTSKAESIKLIEDTSSILKEKLNMDIKGWSISGEKPPSEVTKDDVSVELGGHIWYPEADIFTLNIPPMCFAKKQRGKLPAGEIVFDSKTMEMKEFVPHQLTRRMITSAVAKVWDLLGKTAPVTLRIKQDIRMLIKEVPEWDVAVSPKARSLWIQNFIQIEKLRGIMYPRCSRPDDALRSTCRLWVLVDAAEWGMILSVYAGWERANGEYSCSHLYGKGLLGPEELTLPQKELHVLSKGADIVDLFSVAIEEWVEEILIGSDSEIAICWAAYETVKLNQFNRVRVINITSKINLDNLFHIKGSENPADIGTRMKVVSYEDVLPGSEYLCGRSWMKLSKQEAITAGFIKPVNQIKLAHEQKKIMKKGIVFDSFEDETSDAIAVLLPARIDVKKVAQRLAESHYVYSPLERNFLSFIDVVAIVLKVRTWSKNKISDEDHITPKFSALDFYSNKVVKPPPSRIITDLDRSKALDYIYRTETKLLKQFNDPKKLDKIGIEKDGIIFSKTRVLEGQTVKVVGGLNLDTSLSGLFDLNFEVPIVDNHSPLAYPLALHLHSLFNHRGYESCYRLSLNRVKILGGLQIFKNITLNCVVCLKDRKKYLKMVMGNLTDCQLSITPVFYYTLVDMFGPVKCYAPGQEKQTRRDKSYEAHFLVFSCVATGAVNVQLIEGKRTDFILDGCSRFFNETGVPKIMFPDDDGGLVRAFTRGEICLEDVSGNLYRTRGIHFELCPPQSHSSHGRVERVIRSLQDSFVRSGASSNRCTATGCMTMGKAMEHEVNNIPIGFLFDRSTVEGNPILRLLKPNSLRGFNASDRAPKGLFSIPNLPEDHFTRVQVAYEAWAQCWATSYLPNILLDRQKWTEEDPCVNVNDIVYFKMKDSKLKIEWKLGKVDSVKISRDGKVREVQVAYKIMKEDNRWEHNVVCRPVREMIKLFELGDTTFAEDIANVHKMAKEFLIQKQSIPPSNLKTISSLAAPTSTQTNNVACASDFMSELSSELSSRHRHFLSCSRSDWVMSCSIGSKSSSVPTSETDLDKKIDKDIYDDNEHNDILFMI